MKTRLRSLPAPRTLLVTDDVSRPGGHAPRILPGGKRRRNEAHGGRRGGAQRGALEAAQLDWRTTSFVGNRVVGGTSSPSMRRTSVRAISVPISIDGWCTVVNGGIAVAA